MAINRQEAELMGQETSSVSRDHQFTITVAGPNARFMGSYGSITASGQSSQKSVEGIAPESYQVTGIIASATFQMTEETGYLEVTIERDGQIVANEYTDAAYGCVSVSTSR